MIASCWLVNNLSCYIFSKNQTWSFSVERRNSPVFPMDLFFLNFFLSVCCWQYELLYVLFWYFSILISFNMLLHQVNVTEVDVSTKIELWQRNVSHDHSKLNVCIFDVYVCIYNITYIYIYIYILNNFIYFVFVKSCFIILVTDILIYYYRYVVILLNFILSFETVLF